MKKTMKLLCLAVCFILISLSLSACATLDGTYVNVDGSELVFNGTTMTLNGVSGTFKIKQKAIVFYGEGQDEIEYSYKKDGVKIVLGGVEYLLLGAKLTETPAPAAE